MKEALNGRSSIKSFSTKRQPKKAELKGFVFPSVLLFLYTVFVFPPDLTKTPPVLAAWFTAVGAACGTGLYRYIRIRPEVSEWKSLEFLLPLLLLAESIIQFTGTPLLHLIYIPFVVVITGYFSLQIIIICTIAIMLLGAPTLWWIDIYPFQTVHLASSSQQGPDPLRWVYLLIAATGILSYSLFHWKTKISKKALAELEQLKNSAINLESSIESDIFHEDRFSHALKSILETQKELSVMLVLAKKALNADSATLFTLEHDDLVIKASTEDIEEQPTYAEKGYLSGVIKERIPVVQTKLKDGFFGLRHRHSDEAGSFLCVPVLDGNVPLGAIVVDSRRADAFGDREKDVAGEFAVQTKQILRRTRLYVEVERFTKGFKALHDASKTLSTSLKIEEIAAAFVDLVSGMVSSSAVGFFVVDKGKLRILAKKGFEPEKNSFYTKGTFFDFIVRNKQTMHLSRLDRKEGVLPFRINETRTFLGIPIIPGNELFGVLAVSSREPDAISSFQAHLMETVADQATMYINNAQLHNKVEKLAITDGLTGLYNHKHFQERLNDEFARIKRIPQTLSLMLIDIDHFKKINDTYGHPVGDSVLKNIAQLLRKTLRGIDIIARYGGEEFAAVLMGTGNIGAKKMAERLRSSIMNTPFFIDEHKISVTLSLGIAVYPNDAGAKEDLIDKADKALYHAKENGRNQVCEWKDLNK